MYVPNYNPPHNTPAPKTRPVADKNVFNFTPIIANDKYLLRSLNTAFTTAGVSFTDAGGARELSLRLHDAGLASTCLGRVVEGTAAGVGGQGCRYKLRVQMNIERKRARLFQDIQLLPYT